MLDLYMCAILYIVSAVGIQSTDNLLWGIFWLIIGIFCMIYGFNKIEEPKMNKQTLENLKKYVKKNALKFTKKVDSREDKYIYKELEIGFGSDFGAKIVYFIIICGKYMNDVIPQEFIEELFYIINYRKEKSKKDIEKQAFDNFIKKINKGVKNV